MQGNTLSIRTAEAAVDQKSSSEALKEVAPVPPQSSLAEITEAIDLSLRTEVVKRPGTLQKFIGAFNALEICEPSKEATTLNELITKLYEKSPEMLGKILDNCRWLKDKARLSFIYSATVAGIEMELADIFDQAGFNALPNGIQPDVGIMIGSNWHVQYDEIGLFEPPSKAVLEKSAKNFYK
jgi:hypothetical protein